MKRLSAQSARFFALLGGLAALAGFTLLPFNEDPRAGDFRNGLAVLWDYGVLVRRTMESGLINRVVPDPNLVSFISLWVLLALFAVLPFCAAMAVVRKTFGRRFALLTSLLSLAGLAGLYLSVYRWIGGEAGYDLVNGQWVPQDTRNELLIVLSDASKYVSTGWWVSALGLMLVLLASLGLLMNALRKPRSAAGMQTKEQ